MLKHDYLACVCVLPLPRLQAARWRQEQRSDDFEQRKLIVWEVDGSEPEPWQGEQRLGAVEPE